MPALTRNRRRGRGSTPWAGTPAVAWTAPCLRRRIADLELGTVARRASIRSPA